MTAVKELTQPRAFLDEERADPFGGVQLVAGERQKIDAELRHVDGDLADRLDGVCVQMEVLLSASAPFCNQGADLFERLNRPGLVVGEHDGDQNRLVRKGGADVVDADPADRRDRKIG